MFSVSCDLMDNIYKKLELEPQFIYTCEHTDIINIERKDKCIDNFTVIKKG